MIADIHNHLLPAVDDGASSIDESRRGLESLRAAGVGVVVVTPHIRGSETISPEARAQRLEELDAGWAALRRLVDAEYPDLDVRRGAECMLDVPAPDLSDGRLRIAGGPFVLVEFAFMGVPPRAGEVLRSLRHGPYRPVLAHPERYAGVAPDLASVAEWRAAGAFLQVNGGSLVGRYGSRAQLLARAILERGWACCVCSDYHSRGAPGIAEYSGLLRQTAGEEIAALLLETNPGRIVAGLDPILVPPFKGKLSIWTRLARSLPWGSGRTRASR